MHENKPEQQYPWINAQGEKSMTTDFKPANIDLFMKNEDDYPRVAHTSCGLKRRIYARLACEECRVSHSRCVGENEAPCMRCVERGTRCIKTERKKRAVADRISKKQVTESISVHTPYIIMIAPDGKTATAQKSNLYALQKRKSPRRVASCEECAKSRKRCTRQNGEESCKRCFDRGIKCVSTMKEAKIEREQQENPVQVSSRLLPSIYQKLSELEIQERNR